MTTQAIQTQRPQPQPQPQQNVQRETSLADKLPSMKNLGKIAVGVSIVAVAYVIISRRMRKKEEERNYLAMEQTVGAGSPEARYTKFASLYYSAMKKAGWFGWGWGTDEKLIYETTANIRKTKTPFGKVAIAYNKLYNRHLLRDLQKELKPDEYSKFQNILNA